MEKYCTSLELSKQLKEVGWKKETKFWWVNYSYSQEMGLNLIEDFQITDRPIKIGGINSKKFNNFPAPLTDEILEELPKCLINYSKDYPFMITLQNQGVTEMQEDRNLPNALAKMWIYLKKRRVVTTTCRIRR